MEEFRIIYSTFDENGGAKAHLIKSTDGRSTWIMAKMLKDNGQLTEAGQEELNKAEIYIKPGEIDHIVKSDWENDKSIGMNRDIELHGQIKQVMVFFPKSQIKEGKVKGWLWNLKMKEVIEKNTFSGYGVPWFID